MWEHLGMYRGHNLWMGRDAEGRKIYAATRQEQGLPAREPSAQRGHYYLQAAKQDVRESIDLEFDAFCEVHDDVRGRE
jgi:hypothetical protein